MSIKTDIYDWDAWIDLAPEYDWDKLSRSPTPDPDPDPDPEPDPEAGAYAADYRASY